MDPGSRSGPEGPAGPSTGRGIMTSAVRRTLKAGEIPTTLVDCVHAERCGGCPLIGVDYAQQLAAKRARVASAIVHYPTLELVYTRPVVPSDQIVGYRGRAKLIVSPSGGIGLYGRSGNHDVVDIPHCRVLAPTLAEITSMLRSLIAAPPEPVKALLLPYDPQAGGVLRALDLREVLLPPESRYVAPPAESSQLPRAGVLLTFVLQRDRVQSREELREAGRAIRAMLPRVIGVAANLHEADAPQILGPETILLDGTAQAEDRIGSTYHVASFGSFVQVHRAQASRVHTLITREIAALDLDSLVESGARRQARVLDLYGGSGAISIALAHAKNEVVMIESFAPAVLNARTAAEAQGIALDARTGDAAEVVTTLVAAGEKFDAVVMNPPRRGVSPAAREAIARVAAPLLM